jgi:phosphatidylserine/phosphatidylglycerophosphate/cardiolipin synthase-like enzyme
MINLIIEKSTKGVYTRLYVNDYDKQKNQLKKLMDYRSKFLRIFNYQKNAEDSMAALHAKAIIVDEKQLLVSSANLSYHGMQGNIEMGIRIESQEKAKQVEDLLKELVRMKTFTELRKD